MTTESEQEEEEKPTAAPEAEAEAGEPSALGGQAEPQPPAETSAPVETSAPPAQPPAEPSTPPAEPSAAGAAAEGQEDAQPPVKGRAWFVVHAQSGYEDKVRTTLLQKVESDNLSSRIFRVFIPTEDVVEIKRNKKVVKKRKFFPGYVLVDMVVDNETYWAVKNIHGVSGFLGEPKPTPLPLEEVQQILDLTAESAQGKPKPAVQFEKGESIRITEGPFRHFVGVVEDVNEPKAKLKVMVTIFGRPTPVELDFLQVEKI